MEQTGRRIVLKDETVFEDSSAGYADGRLWVWLTGISLMDALPIMTDAEKTAVIVFDYGEMTDIYEGFTEVCVIQQDGDGCAVCLKKAVND